jgi:cytochrome b subunit of formate dehydrogenase
MEKEEHKISKRKISMKKRLVSIVLFFDVIVLAITGIIMIFDDFINEPAEFVANVIHSVAGIAFMFFTVYHIIYNWKTLKFYLKKMK